MMSKIIALLNLVIFSFSTWLPGQNAEYNFSHSNVIGNTNVGGLIGYVESSSVVRNNYARGQVIGINFIGGFIGNNYGHIENNYSTGFVSGPGSQTGGLIGANNGTVFHSYWDMETSFTSFSAGGEGRSTAEMNVPYASNTFLNWNFNEIWSDDAIPLQNEGYPIIKTSDAYKLNTRVFPLGSGTVSQGGYFKAFQEIQLQAVAETGFTFRGWMQQNTIIQSSPLFAYTILDNTNLTAIFEPLTNSTLETPSNKLSIKISPNPSSNRIWITLTNTETVIKTVNIISMEGKIMKSIKIDSQLLSNDFSIEIADLPIGLYILHLISAKEQLTAKFIKS